MIKKGKACWSEERHAGIANGIGGPANSFASSIRNASKDTFAGRVSVAVG